MSAETDYHVREVLHDGGLSDDHYHAVWRELEGLPAEGSTVAAERPSPKRQRDWEWLNDPNRPREAA